MSWTSVKGGSEDFGSWLEAGKTYYLEEKSAPEGYDIVETVVAFKVEEDGRITVTETETNGAVVYDEGAKTLIVKDKKSKAKEVKILVSKQDLNGTELAGAKMKLFAEGEEKVLKEWTSAVEDGHFTAEVGKKYTLHEEAAPDGYEVTTDIHFHAVEKEDGTVGITVDQTFSNGEYKLETQEDGTPKLIVKDARKKAELQISKEDLGGHEINGAKLTIKDVTDQQNPKDIKSFTSTAGTVTDDELFSVEVGRQYVLFEEAAPSGYEMVESEIRFHAEVITEGEGDAKVEKVVVVLDDQKTDGEYELVSITDESGNKIGQKLILKDAPILVDIAISKQDLNVTGEEFKELAGAHMSVTGKFSADQDAQEETITWTSDGKAPKQFKVVFGETYVLEEKTAPKDYEPIVSSRIEFKVAALDENGKAVIEVLDTRTDGEAVLNSKEDYEIQAADGTEGSRPILVIKDAPKKRVHIKVSKEELGVAGKEVAGARLLVKEKDTGTLIDSWASSDKGPHELTSLVAGREYVLSETAAPVGYEAISTDITFKAVLNEDGSVKIDVTDIETKSEYEVRDVTDEETGKSEQILVVKDAPKKKAVVEISKQDLHANEVAGARLKVVNEKGTVISEWTSTARDDGKLDRHTFMVDAGENHIYTLSEVYAPEGYEKVTTKVVFTAEVNDKGETVLTILNAEETKDSATVIQYNQNYFDENNNPKSETSNVLVLKNAPEKAKDIHVQLHKTDLSGSREVKGAIISIFEVDESGKIIDEEHPVVAWTSDGKVSEDFGDKLEAGKHYLMKEELSEAADQAVDAEGNPVSYAVISDVLFTINHKGEVEIEKTTTNGRVETVTDKNGMTTIQIMDAVEMAEDRQVTVRVSKTDLTGLEELGGAVIEVRKVHHTGGTSGSVGSVPGEIVASWTSRAGIVHEFMVEAGMDYAMKEVAAPDGYLPVTTTMYFHADEDGYITLMKAITDGVSEELVEVDAIESINGSKAVIRQDAENNDVLTIMDKANTFVFRKTDLAGEEVEGAEIVITDENGRIIDSWISESKSDDDESDGHVIALNVNKEYVLKETAAPAGYQVISEIRFTVDENGKITVMENKTDGLMEQDDEGHIIIKNAPIHLHLNKTNLAGSNEITGALINIWQLDSSSDKPVISWKSEAGISEDFGSVLTAGKVYEMEEIISASDIKTLDQNGAEVLDQEENPYQYDVISNVRFKVENDGSITILKQSTTGYAEQTVNTNEDGQRVTTLIIRDAYKIEEDKKTTVRINKKNLGGQEVEGAKIEITNPRTGKVMEWTSTEGTHDFIVEKDMEYTLKETTSPLGYLPVTTIITFKVNADGDITIMKAETDGATGADYELTTDLATGANSVKDKLTGNVVANVEKSDKQDILTLLDAPIELNLNKTDLAGEEIDGAVIQIFDENHNPLRDEEGHVISWTSKAGESYDFGQYLQVEKTWYLEEVSEPDGYEKVETTIEFVIAKDGSVTVKNVTVDGKEVSEENLDAFINENGGAIYDEATHTVLLKDKKKENDIHLQLEKTDLTGTAEIHGAKMTIRKYHENGFYQDEDLITEWISNGAASKDFGNLLEVGQVYILSEVFATDLDENAGTVLDQNGSPVLDEEGNAKKYDVITDILFTIKEDLSVEIIKSTTSGDVEVVTATDQDGNVENRLIIKDAIIEKEEEIIDDGLITVQINKTDLGGEEVDDAVITIQKVLDMDEEGNITSVELIDNGKWTSKVGEIHSFKVEPGIKYILNETAAPNGYEAITQVIFTADEKGNVTILKQSSTGYVETAVEEIKADEEGSQPGEKPGTGNQPGTGSDRPAYTAGQEVVTTLIIKDALESDAKQIPVVIDKKDMGTSFKDENGHTSVEYKDVAGATLTVAKVAKPGTGGDTGSGAGTEIDTGKAEVITSWTSGSGSDHTFMAEPGVVYLLHESFENEEDRIVRDKEGNPVTETVETENGTVTRTKYYDVITDVLFTIDENGTITLLQQSSTGFVEKAVTTDVDGHTVSRLIVHDAIVDDSMVEIEINIEELLGPEIEGADIKVFDEDGHMISEWDSSKGSTLKVKVQPGRPFQFMSARSLRGYLPNLGKPAASQNPEETPQKPEDQKPGEPNSGIWFKYKPETGIVLLKSNGANSENSDENFDEIKPEDQYDDIAETEETSNGEGVPAGVDNLLVVKVKPIKLQINKTDMTGNQELTGAELTVKDASGNTVTSWISREGETHEFGNLLMAGEIYTLEEEHAPEGYKTVSSFTFKVNNDGTVTVMDAVTDGEAEVKYLNEKGEEVEAGQGNPVLIIKDKKFDGSDDKEDDKPGTGGEDKPGEDDQPGTGGDKPSEGDKPGTGGDKPGEDDKPGTGGDKPGEDDKPGTGGDKPGEGDKPGAGENKPGEGNHTAGTVNPLPGTGSNSGNSGNSGTSNNDKPGTDKPGGTTGNTGSGNNGNNGSGQSNKPSSNPGNTSTNTGNTNASNSNTGLNGNKPGINIPSNNGNGTGTGNTSGNTSSSGNHSSTSTPHVTDTVNKVTDSTTNLGGGAQSSTRPNTTTVSNSSSTAKTTDSVSKVTSGTRTSAALHAEFFTILLAGSAAGIGCLTYGKGRSRKNKADTNE